MKKNIALVMGGYSGEHDISIASGNQVYGQLDHTKYNVYKIVVEREGWYWLDGEEHRPVDRGSFTVIDNGHIVHFDLAFIIIHGNPGENGVLQGYFDMLGIRYTTCGFYTSALTFQKGYCNPVVKSFGVVKVAESALLYSMDDLPKTERLRLPVFVKPAAGGSSVATTKVKCAEQLVPAIREAFTEDHAVMVEECINGREFDCGVFRKADGEKLVFPITEIIPKGGHEFFDYEAKYQGFSNEVTPAECPETVSKHIQEVSSRLYDLLGCKGIVRFDYIYGTPSPCGDSPLKGGERGGKGDSCLEGGERDGKGDSHGTPSPCGDSPLEGGERDGKGDSHGTPSPCGDSPLKGGEREECGDYPLEGGERERKGGEPELYFLEVNTIPGQSAESIVPKQAKAMGITPAELYEMSIQAALAD